MKKVILVVMALLISGCATWKGVKEDTKEGAEWTKTKINKGAEYVKEKTE